MTSSLAYFVSSELPPTDKEKHSTLYLCTSTQHDAISATESSADRATAFIGAQLETGTKLPSVIFLGMRGRIAFFQVPVEGQAVVKGVKDLSSGARGGFVRVFASLVNIAQSAKAARHFFKQPPKVGAVFKNATVVKPACRDEYVSRKGARLPLSSQMAEISLLGENC